MNRVCPSCDTRSPIEFRYCGHCGAPLDAPTAESGHAATQPRDEENSRRLATVLFCDLVNYTRTAARVDPDTVYYTVRELFERLARAIRQQGGYIDRYIGDGFLAAFGVPEAHEDDPARALRAALAMQQIVIGLRSKAKASLDWELELRIGVNTGSVIRGSIDTGSLLDASIFGHAVNLASRLQEAARPSTTLVSEAVYRRTRALFDFADPVRLQLKGIDRPVIGYELVGQRADPLPSRGLIGRKTELVGRQREFELLSTGLRKLQVDRTGMIALVTGPAGIGKTRLIDDVLGQLAGRFSAIRSGCSPTDGISYALLTSVLESLAGIEPDDPPARRQQRVDELLRPAGALAHELGPVLNDILGTLRAGEQSNKDPQGSQRRILAASRRLFAWLARRQPLILVLDDLQWADPSSLEVLTHISDLVAEVPLALIAITRSSAHKRLVGKLGQHQMVFRDIRLRPLSTSESDLLVSLLLSKIALPAALRRSIVSRGGGTPLLIEELVRMLLDEDVIRQTATGWQIEDHWAEVVQTVPDTVGGLILSRFDRLASSLRQLLVQAAVLGPSFSQPLLSATSGLPEQEMRDQLRRLEEADFLRRSAGASAPVYFFRHALLHEAIYDTLLQNEKRELHGRAAEAIQTLADDLASNPAALIGHHLEKASTPAAIPYLMQAATQAANRYANHEAINWYQRARALLAADGTNREWTIDIGLGLAEMLERVGELEQAFEMLEQARSLTDDLPADGYRLGDIFFRLGRLEAARGELAAAETAFGLAAERLDGAIIPEPAFSRSEIEQELGWLMCRQGKLVEAQAHAETALTLAQARSDMGAVAGAYHLLTPVHYWAGRLTEAVASARDALAIREQIGDIWGAASSQTNLAGIYHRLGQWDEAESLLRQAVFVRQEIGDHPGVVLSSNVLGLLLLESGRYDEALDWLEQAFATLRIHPVAPDLASQLYGNRGLLWLRKNEIEAARHDLAQCLDHADQANNDDLRALALAYLAEAHLADGEPDQARQMLDEGRKLCTASNGAPEISAELLRVQSLLLRSEHAWAAALEANAQARTLYQKIGNRYEVAHLMLESSEIRLAWHDHDPQITIDSSVKSNVLAARAVFQDLPAQALIAQAEEALARLSIIGKQAVDGESWLGQWPVVLAHFYLTIPAREPKDATLISETREQLAHRLAQVGRSSGALVVSDTTSLVYLFSDREPKAARKLVHSAIKCARAALDAGIHFERASRRQHDLSISLTAGIVAGRWDRTIHDQQTASSYVSASPAAQQAAALAAMGQQNAILLAGAAAASAQDVYDLEAIEQSAIPGPVFRLGRARAANGVPQALPGSTSQLIGRLAEIEKLRGWLDGIRTEPHGAVCYLEAKAGMGKSRLVKEVIAYAGRDVLCLSCKCESFRSNISYWPLIDLLEQGGFPETAAGRQLKGLLGLRVPDQTDDLLLRNVAPADLQRELYGRLRAFVLDLSDRQPLLLVLEDIHCIDLSSLDLIGFLLPLTFHARISLMLVSRAEVPGPHRALVSQAERVCRDNYLRVSFSALAESESVALIKSLLKTEDLPDQLWPLVAPFAGHPLSLEEALRFLVERGWLWRTNGAWRLAHADGRPGRGMPTTFGDLVLGRLETLDKETLHVFQAAAVLGEQFDRTVLARIVPGPSLPQRLAELVARGWLMTPEADQPHLYRFKHTLTRETVYATLLASKRQLVHQRAAEAIRALYPEAEEEHLELLAHHFSQSSLRMEAVHYLVRAAEKSATRHALAEGLSFFTWAEEKLGRLPQSRSRLLPRIALGLADVHLMRGEPASAASHLTPLISTSDQDLGPEWHAGALRRLGEAQREMGAFPAALAYYREGLALLHANAPDQEFESWSTRLGAAQTLFDMRENQPARDEVEQLLDSLDQQKFPGLAARAMSLLGGIAHRQGDSAGAAILVQQGLSINRQIGNRSGVAAAYSNLGILAATDHDSSQAHDFFTLSLAIHRELGNSQGIAIAENNLGQLEINRGRFEPAIEHLTAGVTTARRAELIQILTQSLANLGRALALIGQTDASLTNLNEAESLCERYGFRNLLCEVLWKRAEVLIEIGDLAAARTTAHAALKLAERLASGDLTSETQRVLARTHRHQNRIRAALAMASAAWHDRAGKTDRNSRARYAAEYALALLAAGQQTKARHLLLAEVAPAALCETPTALQEITEALHWAQSVPD